MTLAEAPLPAGPVEGLARRVLFEHADWGFYQQMLRAVGDGPQRITYDRGRLEVEVPSREHERIKSVLRRLVEAYADERDIDLYALASTTLHREDMDGGLEADEAWYVGENARRAVSDAPADSVDPPPDIALEVDLSPPSVKKEPIYEGLGVREVWRWKTGALSCLMLQAGGSYAPVAESTVLSGFPFDLATELTRQCGTQLESKLVAILREWCRTRKQS